MTSLMVIFMFIAISYIVEVQKRQKEREVEMQKRQKERDIIFEEFKATKDNLYAELKEEFKDNFKEWQVELDKDLSIKFTNPDVLFELGSTAIRPRFQNILDEFFPRYFRILLKKEYRSRISEIRIEGHTDTKAAPRISQDPYIANIILSQSRSAEVLKYFRNMNYYKTELTPDEETLLQFWLTANGLSFGRTLDDNKNLTLETGNPVNDAYSRRVEFRVVTKSEELVERVIKEQLSGEGK